MIFVSALRILLFRNADKKKRHKEQTLHRSVSETPSTV